MAGLRSASAVRERIAGWLPDRSSATPDDWRRAARRLRHALETPRSFLALIAALLTFGVLWAAVAEVDQVVRVEGRIIPAGRSQQIQHLEGGIVAAIAIAEGQAVRAGDLLLTIDATTADATLSETQVKLLGSRVRAARLTAEIDNAESLQLDPALRDAPSGGTEVQLFQSRRRKLEQELRGHREQVRQRAAELREIELRRARLSTEMATARQRSALVNALAAKNAASRLEALEAESREQRLATELSDAESSIPKLTAALAEAEARIEQAQLTFRAQAQDELAATQVEMDRLRQIVAAQSDRVSRTELRAPVTGVVNRLAVSTIGGVIKPGDTVVEITPRTEQVQIEARARPSDRGDLRPGLQAKVRVSAYDVGRLGVLDGRLVEVSADTVPDGRGESFYRVVLRVDALPQSYADRLLAPGMTVTGDVVTGRRTLLDHLTSPLHKFAYNAFRDAR